MWLEPGLFRKKKLLRFSMLSSSDSMNSYDAQVVHQMKKLCIRRADCADGPHSYIPIGSAGCASVPQVGWSECSPDRDPPLELLTNAPSKVGWKCEMTSCFQPTSTMLIHPRFLNNWCRFAITAVALRDFEVALGSHREGVDETPKRR